MGENSGERLRPPPAQRFADPEDVVDLASALAALRLEPDGSQGHRQITVFHRGPVRMILFTFERGGELPPHAANGEVCIHVLAGLLDVRTEAAIHVLRAGCALLLDPGVRHAVAAREPSDMLLTVHLHGAPAA